jgi:hypothetical protein
MTILVLTVGGSHQPILTAIGALRPDRVVFLCSDDTPAGKGSWVQVIGEGKVIKSRPGLDRPDLPNITTLAALPPDRYEVVRVRDFDSLEACYHAALATLDRLRRQWPEARVVADYTGGTKSMTAGLAIAAVDDERCEMNLIAGTRADLERIRDQTQFAQPVAVWDVRARRQLREVGTRVACFDYAGAAGLLERIALTPVSRELRETVRAWVAICRGLDAWDRFAHAEARRLLEPYRKLLIPHWGMLDALCHREPRDPYLRVDDLLFNAERRAEQGRHDDAVARAYRAMELIAQTRLRSPYSIDTSDVDLLKVPEHARANLERNRDQTGRIRLALVQAWELLQAVGDEPLGAWFAAAKGELQALLEIRNASILAHGNVPIGRDLFRDKGMRLIFLGREAVTLVARGGRRIALQLPRSLPEEPVETPDAASETPQRALLAPGDAAAVAEFAARIRGELGNEVLEIRLFGSKATGRDVLGSDIDVLVVVGEARPDVEKAILAVAFDVNLAHDVFISPSVVGRATLEDPMWRNTPFLQAATRGLPL